MEEEVLVEVELKLKRRHPHNVFKIQEHRIGNVFATYEMNEAELKELDSPGCKHWVISKKEFGKNEKKASKKRRK